MIPITLADHIILCCIESQTHNFTLALENQTNKTSSNKILLFPSFTLGSEKFYAKQDQCSLCLNLLIDMYKTLSQHNTKQVLTLFNIRL